MGEISRLKIHDLSGVNKASILEVSVLGSMSDLISN